MKLTNWAGNVTFRARQLHRPTSLEELGAIVAGAAGAGSLRVLGTGHSFNDIADTEGDLVSVAALPRVVEVDRAGMSVRVSGGTSYGELATRLQEEGLALHNLGSLPHISVAGACSTGTHGSGVGNRNLASAVRSVELLGAGGRRWTCSRGEEPFGGSVLALGALGVITHLTLDVEPTYDVRQVVYEDLPFGAVEEDLEGVMSSAYSVSLFTDWRRGRFTQAWLKQRAGEEPPGPRWRGARRATRALHMAPGMPAAHCTPQLGSTGPWSSHLAHFRQEFTPSSGEELQSEWFLPMGAGVDALRAVREVAAQVAPVLLVGEIRTVAADELWISPAQGRDTLAVHFTWVPDPAAVAPVVRLLEERLARYDARPHWAKVHSATPEVVAARYPHLDRMRALLAERDPYGVFRNALVERYLPRVGAAGRAAGSGAPPPAGG